MLVAQPERKYVPQPTHHRDRIDYGNHDDYCEFLDGLNHDGYGHNPDDGDDEQRRLANV
jgi:hypothetical protein